MSLLTVGLALVLVFFAQTMSIPTYYGLESTMMPPSCRPCCDTRRHGELIVHAKVIPDDCIKPTYSSSIVSSTTSEIMTTTEYCNPCCDRRRHGIVVVEARVMDGRLEPPGRLQNYSRPYVFVE